MSQPTESGALRVAKPGIIHWSNVGRTLAEILAGSHPRASRQIARMLVRELAEPLGLLDELWRIARAVQARDETFADRLFELLVRLVRATDGKNAREAQSDERARCECSERVKTGDDVARARDRGPSSAGETALLGRTIAPTGEIFDEGNLARLVGTAIGIARDRGSSLLSPDDARNAVLGVINRSLQIALLTRAEAEGGRIALFRALNELRFTPTLPLTSQTMSGTLPAEVDLPAFDDVPVPEEIDPIDVIDIFRKEVAELLGGMRKPKIIDILKISGVYPGLQPVKQHDPEGLYPALKCFREFNRLMGLINTPPPTPPPVVVWSLGITSVSLSGHCAGDRITIHGSGFGQSQPPGVALLLPTLNGCRPVAPLSWSDTRIEAILPLRVASGPVGFGDANYIAEYDAWAARMRALQDELARLSCGYRMDPILGFGQCPPVTAFNRIEAGTPEILAFHANGENVHVLEVGDALELTWSVKNAKSITITRVTPTAPGFSGASSLVPATGQISHAFGAVNHEGAFIWEYRLAAMGFCGGPHTASVQVVTVKKPKLRVVSMQVIQSIQTHDHSVPLVTGKPTVVRVLINNGLGGWNGGTVPRVTGLLRMYRDGQYSPWLHAAPTGVRPMGAKPGTSIDVVAAPSMNDHQQTLNFVLPIDWCAGSASYQVEIRVEGFAANSAFPGFADIAFGWSPRVGFQPRRVLRLRFIEVNWNGGGAPGAQVCRNTLWGAIPLLPTPVADIAPLPGWGVEMRNAGLSDAEEAAARRNMLDDFDDWHDCGTLAAAAEWLGLDCPPDDGTMWVLIPGQFKQGEAATIPGKVCYTPPSDGPYAAHELSHCFGQLHIRLPVGANGPKGGIAASDWENNGMLLDVPFDTQGTAGTAEGGDLPRALSLAATNDGGTGVADVMTYWGTPNGTWPSPRRWLDLWKAIGA